MAPKARRVKSPNRKDESGLFLFVVGATAAILGLIAGVIAAAIVTAAFAAVGAGIGALIGG